MKKYIYLIILSFLVSCEFGTKKHFFDFDQVNHYSTEKGVKDTEFGKLLNFDFEDTSQISLLNKEPTENEILFDEILLKGTPKSLSDTSFLKKLNVLGYEKRQIKASVLKTINNIFSYRDYHDQLTAQACPAVFRDILIFRKQSKITGIAKICFSCDKKSLVGSKFKTHNFGMNEEFEKLRRALYP